MKQLLTGKQMKQADTWSIKEFGMESLILMERAALCAAQHIMSVQKPGCVFIMCGMGNNGADGLAMARILSQNGWSVRIAAIGQIEKATKEWLYQKSLLDKMEILPVQYFYESDDKDEKEYKGDINKNDLIVFYDVSTKSIPAQTTPTKVVVLGENEIALKQIEAAKNATPAPTASPKVTEAPQVSYAGLVNVVIGDKNVSDVYAKDNTTMVPLREVAEAAGFTVTWDAENRAVILNDGVYSLKIGENSYVKGKMMPLTLSAAPEIVNDLTYVPAEFFAEVTESATVDGTSLVVTAK